MYYCDGCGADTHRPPRGNGDVTVCGWCIHDYREDPIFRARVIANAKLVASI